MIKLGPAGKPIGFKGNFLDCTLYLKEIGLNAVEVQFVRQVWMNEKQAIEFGEKAKVNGISVSVHAPYFI
ncbi:MAG: deoxyribonuclease IV, partial [Candidatus Nanoarchaeia archaeon]|nr:deoxyribonuclease IV [Candidatus Jingweiarchaeum tengchongense]